MWKKFKPYLCLFLLGFACCELITAQETQKSTLSGYIRDEATGEVLVGANIRIKDHPTLQTSTNQAGFFSLRVSHGTLEVLFSFTGFEEQKLHIRFHQDTLLHVALRQGQVLDEVVVSAGRQQDQLRNPQMGMTKVDLLDVAHVPVLFGEKDILKTIQLLPGVMSGGEGSSQFFVRGGQGDQNLILLDGAPVFNASHLLGFFSTFNSDAIRDVTLYKGGMPAKYGGRLASVLDIQMDEGNNKRFAAEGGLGLIASRIKIEGPLVRDKGSFMVSGRRTYADLFLKLSSDPDISQSKLYFYDLNLKANYRLDDKNALFLSGYFGQDVLGYADRFGFDWGNATGSIRWQHLISPRLFSHTTAVYSDYKYKVDLMDPTLDFVIASNIRSGHLKQDFQFFERSQSTFNGGIDMLYQKINPTNINAGEQASVNTIPMEGRNGTEVAAYLSHDWKPTPELSLLYGLRYSHFLMHGPGQFFTYDPATGDIRSSRTYEKGQLVQHYAFLEPRFSLSYNFHRLHSVKASYSKNTQNLHLLSNSTSSLPTDDWVLSSPNVKPQVSDQVSLGYYSDWLSGYEFSVEIYYKEMKNQIDYKDAADLQLNTHLEAELVFGRGRAYGAEWYLKKTVGDLQGWISYGLAKSERQFEAINQGNWFNARQDRTHDLSTVLLYEFSDRWNASATWVYNTGQAVTFPSGKYQVGDQILWYYTERNAHRMPDYHRLDLGVTREGRKNSRFRSSWTFGVYNAYNRKNAYIIDFRESETTPGKSEIYRIALFGVIPSITWNFGF